MGPAPSRDVPGAGELDVDAEDIEDDDDVIRSRPLPDYLVRAHPYSYFSITPTFRSVICYATKISTKLYIIIIIYFIGTASDFSVTAKNMLTVNSKKPLIPECETSYKIESSVESTQKKV